MIKMKTAIAVSDILYIWIIETDDKGCFPETDGALKAVIDRWGDDAVNEEYKRVR